MTTTQKILVAGALSLAVGYGVHQHRIASELRDRLSTTENVSGLASAAGDAASDVAGLRAKIERLTEENDRLQRALDLSGQRQKELGGEAETARRSAALFKELARQANEERTGDTNQYPTPRHLMMDMGKLMLSGARLNNIKRDTLSQDELSAMRDREMEFQRKAIELAQVAKRFGLLDGNQSGDSDPADAGACVLHGMFDLSAEQFNQTYSVLERRTQEARANGVETSETLAAANQAAMSDVRQVLTAEQRKIFDEIAPSMTLISSKKAQGGMIRIERGVQKAP